MTDVQEATLPHQKTDANEISPWISCPVQAHIEWRRGLQVAGRPYAEHSIELYASLFGRFCEWLKKRGLNLVTVHDGDVDLFSKTLLGRKKNPATDRTRRTYLAEISRVMDHLMDVELRQDNPVRALVNAMRIATPLKPRAIFVARPQTRSIYTEILEQMNPDGMGIDGIRGHAMAMLMVDAGMTTKEIQKLTLSAISPATSPESPDDASKECLQILAPGHRILRARSILLSKTGSKWLKAWLECRSNLKVIPTAQYRTAGVLTQKKRLQGFQKSVTTMSDQMARVFVTQAGKSNWSTSGLRGSNFAINKIREEVIYDAAAHVFWLVANRFEEINDIKDLKFRGPQTLRNLYGASLLAKGLSNEETARRLGLVTMDQVWALKRAMPGLLV